MTDMMTLPDPRVIPLAAPNKICDALQSGADEQLRESLLSAFEAGDQALLNAALSGSTPAQARRLVNAMASAIDRRGAGVSLRWFAIPLIMVAGASKACALDGIVPDIEAVSALLAEHGAVGATRNFGLGNALCSEQALQSISAVDLWSAGEAGQQRNLAEHCSPESISIAGKREQVHLRFLVGAGVTPEHLPSFLESASNIGTWGMPLTKALAAQLAQPGLEVLALARPPQPIIKAAYAGRSAQLEAALSLFLGNNVRRFRLSVGDPEAVLSAHQLPGGAGELRLSLSSPFDESLFEGFSWPLHLMDEVAEVSAIMTSALAECRITHVTVLPQMLPERLPNGSAFIAGRMLERLPQSVVKH